MPSNPSWLPDHQFPGFRWLNSRSLKSTSRLTGSSSNSLSSSNLSFSNTRLFFDRKLFSFPRFFTVFSSSHRIGCDPTRLKLGDC